MENSGGISGLQPMSAENEVISRRRPLCYCGMPSKLRTLEMELPDCCKRSLELAQQMNERIAVERARIEHVKFQSMKKKYRNALVASWVVFVVFFFLVNFMQ